MTLKNILISSFCIVGLTACAVNKIPQATGGSKADGTVHLSYEVGPYEKPVVDWTKGKQQAIRRCSAWGYSGSEPFGGAVTRCIVVGAYGCTRSLVTMTYQCTGQNNKRTY